MPETRSVQEQRVRPSGVERWLAFGVTAAVVLWVGFVATYQHELVNWDGLAALAKANDALGHEPAPNLASIGFSRPPLPALAYLPFAALFPGLVQTGYATAVFGAVCLGLGTALVVRLGADLGLPAWVRWAAAAALVCHPFSISHAALGSPVVLLIVGMLGLMRHLAAWADTERIGDLAAAAGYAALIALTRYEAIAVVAALAVYVGGRAVSGDGGSRSRLEGLSIVFLLPMVYALALWAGANWLCTGDPWYSFRLGFASPAAEAVNPWEALALLAPVMALLLAHVVADPGLSRSGLWHGSLAIALATLGSLVWPLLQSDPAAAHVNQQSWPDLLQTAYAVSLAGVLVSGLRFAAGWHGSFHSLGRRPIAGSGVAGGVCALSMLAIVAFPGASPVTPWGALSGKVAFCGSATDTRRAAMLLDVALPKGHRAFAAGWPAFGLALYSGRGAEVTVLPAATHAASVAPVLQEGDLLVVPDGSRQARELGPAGGRLVVAWRSGRWQTFAVGDRERAR